MAGTLGLRRQLHQPTGDRVAPAKARPTCSECGEAVGRSYRVQDGELVCEACERKRIEEEVQRRFVSEQNTLLRKVCPACQRRICREG